MFGRKTTARAKTNLLTTCLLTLALAACGGSSGGGSSSSENDPIEPPISAQRDPENCVESLAANDVYVIDSYNACGDPEGDLTGVWMVVADYQVSSFTGRSFEGQWRMGIRIEEEGDQLRVTSCPGIAFGGQVNVSSAESDATTIEIPDPMTAANIRLEVSDALHMAGQHLSGGGILVNEYSVVRSEVSARKLAEDAELAYGGADIRYEFDGQTGTADNAPVPCFVQSLGETTSGGALIPRAEITTVVANVGSGDAPQYISTSAAVAKPLVEDDATPEDYQAVEVYLGEADTIGSSDPAKLEIEYLSNNRSTIELEAVVEDDQNPDNFATTSVVLGF